MRIASIVAGAALAIALFIPEQAAACGGFFCGGTPIDQSGESIIYGVEGATVEALVQITYTGNAKSFSWVVPTEVLPALSIGSEPVAVAAKMDASTAALSVAEFISRSSGFMV